MTDWKIQRLGNFLEYADYRTLPVNSNTELTFKQSLMNGGTEYVYSSNLSNTRLLYGPHTRL